MQPTARVAPLVILFALVASACGPNHIAHFTPRERTYKPGAYAQRSPSARPSEGSLFSDAVGGYLEDTRAVRVGDVLSIRIDESADAEGGASTNLSRDAKASAGVDSLFGLVTALQKAVPGADVSKFLEYATSSGFAGDGRTRRKGQLAGTLAVRVTREMPNGDLFLEGTKVVLINHEEYHLYVSGIVRPADIAQDNSIASSRIADAQIEFTGRGDVNDQQRKGWLGRAVDAINPF